MILHDTGKLVLIRRGKMTFQVSTNPCCTRRYMGGGGGEEPDEPEISAYGRERAARLGPMLSSMMIGKEGLNNAMGFAGNFDPQRQRNALQKGIKGGKFDLMSQLDRTVKQGDTTVRSYANRSYDQAALGATQGMEENFELQKTADREMAQAMATDMAASGKRMSTGVTDIYNRGNAANADLLASGGTFTENVMSGVGAMSGWMLAGQQRGQQEFGERMQA